MIGIIDVGGGNRGIFGAGVFDYLLEENINFDYCIGVSAGAANIASYQAKQFERNFRFYTIYNMRREAMSLKNLLKKKSYIDLDYIYGDLTRQGMEDPLDYNKMMENPAPFILVATDAWRGIPHYFTKKDMRQDYYGPIAASSCVPVVGKPYFVNGIPYFDGGISDPIPYKKALEDGCDKLVVILTRPRDFYRDPKRDVGFARILAKQYPASGQMFLRRAAVYNRQLSEIKELENKGSLIIVAPDTIGKMKTLNKDLEEMTNLYYKGLYEGARVKSFVEEYQAD